MKTTRRRTARQRPRALAIPLEEEADASGLTARLYDTLRPIKPSKEYVASLRGRLSDRWALSVTQRARLVKLARTMGVALSILAAAAVATRLVGLIVSVVLQDRRGDASAANIQ